MPWMTHSQEERNEFRFQIGKKNYHGQVGKSILRECQIRISLIEKRKHVKFSRNMPMAFDSLRNPLNQTTLELGVFADMARVSPTS
jgi:hypothetical protein